MSCEQEIFATLPAPPSSKSGWPWTVEPEAPLKVVTDIDWPKLTIVTPSYNQGQFIEETIRSILLQGYPNLEYIIIDGGSTDGSVEVIKEYEPWLTYWISEPDSGMYEALNRGFRRSTGEIMAWSPVGDLYVPSALRAIGTVFASISEIEWLTSLHKAKCDEAGRQTACYTVSGFSRRAFLEGMHFLGGNGCARYNVQQQSTFWKRSLWDKTGRSMDASLKAAGDFDLWARFCRHAEIYAIDTPIGVFRTHSSQTSVRLRDRSLKEKQKAFRRSGGKHPGAMLCLIRRSIGSKMVHRSQLLGWLAYKLNLAYQAAVVEWDPATQATGIRRHYFV